MTTAPKPDLAPDKPITAPLQSLIGGRILVLREQRVMLDADLAELYGVQTKVLVQAVKRNLARFPQDFMFQLSLAEFAALRSQTMTSNTGRGGHRTAPYAFTEQGMAMLSSVLGNRSVKPYALMAGVPAKQIGWMSQHGEKLDLPLTGQGTATCKATGLRYQLQNDELTVQENPTCK